MSVTLIMLHNCTLLQASVMLTWTLCSCSICLLAAPSVLHTKLCSITSFNKKGSYLPLLKLASASVVRHPLSAISLCQVSNQRCLKLVALVDLDGCIKRSWGQKMCYNKAIFKNLFFWSNKAQEFHFSIDSLLLCAFLS